MDNYNYSVWCNGKNEYVIGTYKYCYFTDSFNVCYMKDDEWFELTTYVGIDFEDYKNVAEDFCNLTECSEYVSDNQGINLSLPSIVVLMDRG